MNFQEFKKKYQKAPVEEFPNQRAGKKPLVTVKVVTYNHVDYIKECLDSILMQKVNFDYEILIAEDESTDGTREICLDYAKQYPDKIRLLLNSRKNNIYQNGKPSGVFNSIYANFNIHPATKYVAIIEGDDYWTDRLSLQKRADFLENNDDFVICFHNAYKFNQNKQEFSKKRILYYETNYVLQSKDFLKTGMPTVTLMHRAGLVEIFEEGMLKVSSGDVLLRAKLSQFGKAMYLNSIKPAVYRIHSGGEFSGDTLTNNQKKSLDTRLYILEYFKRKDWNTKIVQKDISYVNFLWFIFQYKINKTLNLILLFKSIKHAVFAKIFFLTIWYEVFKELKKQYNAPTNNIY